MIGIFLSMIYFIVIPIIPDKKQPSIVIAIKIPVFVFSPAFTNVATTIPSDKPASDPVIARMKIGKYK